MGWMMVGKCEGGEGGWEACATISDREFCVVRAHEPCGNYLASLCKSISSPWHSILPHLQESHLAFNPEVRRKEYSLSAERNVLLHSRPFRSGSIKSGQITTIETHKMLQSSRYYPFNFYTHPHLHIAHANIFDICFSSN